VKGECSGCEEIKELFITETKKSLRLCKECLEAIWSDTALKEDVEGSEQP